jgi:hypothetical protein
MGLGFRSAVVVCLAVWREVSYGGAYGGAYGGYAPQYGGVTYAAGTPPPQ